MKHRKLYFSFFIITIAAGIAYAQDNASRKLLVKLQPEEYIVTNESCLNISTLSNDLNLVTYQKDQLYIYESGVRKGPFKKPEEVKRITCGEDKNIECSVYRQKDQEPPQEYLSPTDDGKFVINFKGTTYGPYFLVTGFYASPDKTSFTAITADEHMSFSLITSEGINQKLNGTYERFVVSPSGKQYLLLIKEGATMDMAAMQNMTEADMMKYVQELVQQQQNAGEPQTQLLGNGGKLIGKFPSSQFSDINPAFCQTGGDNWYMIIDNSLYVNGNLVRKDDGSLNLLACKIWISSDGKKYAITDYNKFVFSDGNSYPAPIRLEVEKAGTKTILKWLALENTTDLVCYSKEL